MKTRKILAVLMAVVMLAGTFAVCASAASDPYIISTPFTTLYAANEFFDPTGLVINNGLDGDNSKNISYLENPNNFLFEPSLDTPLTEADTTIKVYYAETAFPVYVGSFDISFVASKPIVKEYTDAQYVNPTGLAIYDGSDVVEYTPFNTKFSFSPDADELLSADEFVIEEGAEGYGLDIVTVYYDNVKLGTYTVKVKHVLGELVAIDSQHGHYCIGCGKIFNLEEHDVPEFIPNDDVGLFKQQTETGTCSVCNAEVTRVIEGSEKFLGLFDPENMTEFESEIVGYIYMIAVSLIQMLMGIS